jgi:hypothetical protein
MASDMSYQAEKVELALYIDNESALYPQKQAIIANMKRKIERGEYDAQMAIKGWLHWVNAGAARYCKEFRCEIIRTFPISVRTTVAAEVAEREYEAIKSGEYGPLKNAKKPAKKAVKKAPTRGRKR